MATSTLPQKPFHQLNFGEGIDPEINLLENVYKQRIKRRKWFNAKDLNECEIIQASIEVPLPIGDLEATNTSAVTDSRLSRLAESANRLAARLVFQKRVSDLLVAANLAHPGALELRHSITVQDGNVADHDALPQMDAFIIREAIKFAESIKWPLLRPLNLIKVWEWLSQHEDFLDGFSATPTGRALNAFSRIFETPTQHEPMQLLWALVGIEALYADGNESLTRQIKEKVEAFLGEQELYKKKIGKMYDFRSRFVHGDLNFGGLYLVSDALETVERYNQELFEAVALAIAILTATLQQIIVKEWKGLSFSVNVSNGIE